MRVCLTVCLCINSPATCYTYGDPHFVTFDGKVYDFEGKCRHRLVEHLNGFYSITINTAECSSNQQTSCVKSAQVVFNNLTIDLVPDHPLKDTVLIRDPQKADSEPSLLPVYDKYSGFTFRRLSSQLVEFRGDNGLRVTWDGKSNLHVTLSAEHSGKVQGLCGDFNHNTYDDFGVERSPVSFANKWSESGCPDVVPHVGSTACEVYQQNIKFAEEQCKKLELSPFTDCHRFVDPAPFVENCQQDVCGCPSNRECLCAVLSAYATQCEQQGVVLKWRNNVTCCKYCTCYSRVMC